jgi:hypothetical protein
MSWLSTILFGGHPSGPGDESDHDQLLNAEVDVVE